MRMMPPPYRAPLVLAAGLCGIALLPALAIGQKTNLPGKTAYQRVCAACHLPNLAGTGPSPGLVGNDFKGRWQNLWGADLLERIVAAMPADRPGKLSKAEYRAITAYLLQANGLGRALPPQPGEAALARVKVSAREGQIAASLHFGRAAKPSYKWGILCQPITVAGFMERPVCCRSS